MITLLLATLTLAAVPESVIPAAAPIDVQVRFDGWRADRGLEPATLACSELFTDHARLCFRIRERKKLRWVTEAEVARWGETVQSVAATIRARALERVDERLERVEIPGMGATYWVVRKGDGWDLAPVLHPGAVSAIGEPLLVSLPTDGVVMLWRGGRADVDKVIAVGARELYDTGTRPVSPVVHHWNGKVWLPYARAVARPE